MRKYASLSCKAQGAELYSFASFDESVDQEQVFEALLYELKLHVTEHFSISTDNIPFRAAVLDKYTGEDLTAFWAHGLKAEQTQTPMLVKNVLSNAEMMKVRDNKLFAVVSETQTLPSLLYIPNRKVSKVSEWYNKVCLRSGAVCKNYFYHTVLSYPMDFF